MGVLLTDNAQYNDNTCTLLVPGAHQNITKRVLSSL